MDALFGNAYESARTGFTDDVTANFGPLVMDSFHEYGSPAAGKREVSVDHFGSVELPVGLAYRSLENTIPAPSPTRWIFDPS